MHSQTLGDIQSQDKLLPGVGSTRAWMRSSNLIVDPPLYKKPGFDILLGHMGPPFLDYVSPHDVQPGSPHKECLESCQDIESWMVPLPNYLDGLS